MKTNVILISTFLCLLACNGHAQVSRTTVGGENLVADFYHKEAAERLPGILFLGGSEGGRPDHHLPELFAENGYPVLAVAYFKEKGLPETLQMVPLEYFDQAFAWMERSEHIAHPGVVVVGVSKGAELALLLASRKPEVKGVIALAPSSVVWDGTPRNGGRLRQNRVGASAASRCRLCRSTIARDSPPAIHERFSNSTSNR